MSEFECPICGAEVKDTAEGGSAVFTSFTCGNTREYNMGAVAYTGDCEFAPGPDAHAASYQQGWEAGKKSAQPGEGRCKRPPKGWWCNLREGHEGPCPTREAGVADAEIVLSLGGTPMLRLWSELLPQGFQHFDLAPDIVAKVAVQAVSVDQTLRGIALPPKSPKGLRRLLKGLR